MIGKHTIKSYSKQQKVLALSSAEAETYGMVACSAEVLGIQACAADMGMKFKGTIYADASAALGIVQRRGVGKVRHIRTQSLWLQEAHCTKRLGFEKIDGTLNPSDLMTKHLADTLQQRHLEQMGTRPEGGRAESAPTLNSLGRIEPSRKRYLNGVKYAKGDKNENIAEQGIAMIDRDLNEADRSKDRDRLIGEGKDRHRLIGASSERPPQYPLGKKVRFAPEVIFYRVTPYCEVYGNHPSGFNFDSTARRIPTSAVLLASVEFRSQEEECEGRREVWEDTDRRRRMHVERCTGRTDVQSYGIRPRLKSSSRAEREQRSVVQ